MYAQVIVDIAHAQVDRLFTYAVPEEMRLMTGAHVLVPFGRGNKIIEGFVLALLEAAPERHIEIKHVKKLITPYPIFTQEQLVLAKWMQQSYHCLLVDALRLMIPAQLRGSRISEKTERILSIAAEVDVEHALQSMRMKDGSFKAPRQAEVLMLLERIKGPLALKEICAYYPGTQSAVQALLKKGVLVESGHVTFRRPGKNAYSAPSAPRALTAAQSGAIEHITAAMHAQGGVFLLHGVTGSGKTEVYMRCIRSCIEQGHSALLLVPEIALTPQAMGLFRDRFGDDVALLHSRLSAGERFDEWRRIRLGLAKVAIGARSAVFAPFEQIGLIVIDEEHEPTYQSESAPRYHAMEVARHRAEQHGATLVLGSATPSVTSYFRAQTGRYTLLELPERVMERPMPRIQVVDMREEFRNGNNGIFSGALYIGMEECLAAGKQAILFLNRRGYSTFVSCRGCGYVFLCPDCDISMTYHKTDERVKCHYCGYSAPLPETCPECGKPYVKYFGVGTQQVEEQLYAHFPHVKALRMDLDTTRTKDAHETMFAAFARGEAQVLIGTQMVAKGFDFPNVTLVGVVAADSTLHLPDYRSGERTFQLLMQVAGRAGRDVSPGIVVVQSYTPDHPSIRFAATHDYKGFYVHEMSARRAALFPPFSLFVRALLTGEDAQKLEQDGIALGKMLERAIHEALGEQEKELLYLCASRAPVHKRQGIYRYQVLVKLVRSKNTPRALNAIYSQIDALGAQYGHVTLEVNPGEIV